MTIFTPTLVYLGIFCPFDTGIGIVLVSVNPYRRLDLYSNELIWTFTGRSREELEPHLFAVAEEAYNSLLNEGGSQSIIVSGESGAGKTISAKYIMRYLAEVCKQGSDIGGIEARILATNPILEAFGNAKTVRNDNSSRFGKYVKILFSLQNQIIGAEIKTFLLEKTRVVGHAPGERNYHIFHQMLAGLSEPDLAELSLVSDPGEYAYLGSDIIDAVDDKEEFELTRKSLTLAGFSDVDQWPLWSTLAAILHLGNIRIGEAADIANINDDDPALLQASVLLGVDAALFKRWLSLRLLKAGNETVETPLTVTQSQACRDSVARHLYGLVFDHIINALNLALRPEKLIQPMKFIGVLDIYGFEKFEVNSFEQFCINYANEKLQFQFNQQVFKLEQALYESEGIKWSFINFNDNQPCIDMIEGKQGILKMLAEECRVPNGSDKQLAEKINMKFDESLLCRQKFDKDSQFTVKHFAYNVPYDIYGFLEKNRDSFPPEQFELLRASGSAFIAGLFDEEALTAGSMSKSGSHDAMGRETGKNTGLAFKASLNELMEVMGSTRMHYIRCIKPNQSKEPLLFDSPFVVQQLRACGIIETIRISSAGFPGRWSFADFCHRYRVLAPEEHPDGSPESAAKILEKNSALGEDDYQIGKTRIFLRAGVLGRLEEQRTLKITNAAVAIQSGVRAALERAAFRRTMASVEALQKGSRLCLAKAEYSRLRKNQASTLMASSFRRWSCMNHVSESISSALVISSAWRRYNARSEWREHQKGSSTILLVSAFRGWMQRRSQQALRSSSTSIAIGCRRLLAKQELRRLRSESRSVAKLMENSGALERKVMDLASRLHAMELERDQAREASDLAEESNGLLETQLEKVRAKTAALEAQLQRFQADHETLKAEKDRRILELETLLEETQDRLLRLETGEPAMEMLKRSDSGRLQEPLASHHHLRKLSMDSKLEHIAELTLPVLTATGRENVPVLRKDLMQMLKDPRLLEELQSMVNTSAGYDVRHLEEDSSPLLLRLPALLLEHWIATWLDLDPEPLLLGDNFYNLMSSIRALCARAISAVSLSVP